MRHLTAHLSEPLSSTRLLIAHDTISRFETLDATIRQYRGSQQRCDLLNEYLDTGLELATDAGFKGLTRLQESWLRRVYTTLRDAGLNSECAEQWRQSCLECLYQPFFALSHLYRNRPDGRYALRYLSREMQVISGYLL